jgi:hypothetical protein
MRNININNLNKIILNSCFNILFNVFIQRFYFINESDINNINSNQCENFFLKFLNRQLFKGFSAYELYLQIEMFIIILCNIAF